MDGDAVRHAFREHGNPQTEAARGQVATTDADWAMIPEILAAPDRIAYVGKTRQGLDAIGYWKIASSGEIFYLEEVRTGRNTLAATTMWKKKI